MVEDKIKTLKQNKKYNDASDIYLKSSKVKFLLNQIKNGKINPSNNLSTENKELVNDMLSIVLGNNKIENSDIFDSKIDSFLEIVKDSDNHSYDKNLIDFLNSNVEKDLMTEFQKSALIEKYDIREVVEPKDDESIFDISLGDHTKNMGTYDKTLDFHPSRFYGKSSGFGYMKTTFK
jgi:hypothetical protein